MKFAGKALIVGALAVAARSLWSRKSLARAGANNERATLKENSRSNRHWRFARALGWSFNAG